MARHENVIVFTTKEITKNTKVFFVIFVKHFFVPFVVKFQE